MTSRADTLFAAVAAWRAAPSDPARDAFLRRVAENAEAIADRDRTLGPAAREAAVARMTVLLGHAGDHETLVVELAEAVRSGVVPHDNPALMDHLRRTALDELTIEQPHYRNRLAAPA